MILKKGNMWTNSRAEVKIFTGNATVKNNGCLVMGRGAASEAKALFPGCDQVFGSMIQSHRRATAYYDPYGVLIHLGMHNPILGVFQVKWHFSESALLPLICVSSEMLRGLALKDFKSLTIAMNFPGIGWGGLQREAIVPIISRLPDNVEVWEYPT